MIRFLKRNWLVILILVVVATCWKQISAWVKTKVDALKAGANPPTA